MIAGRCKHKHKHRLTDKKNERRESKKLRRAQRRGEQVEQHDTDNHLNVRSDEPEVQPVQLNRQRVRDARKLSQRKGREMTISRFRQIALSEGSEDEDEASGRQSPDAGVHREEPKIPSSVGKHLRKKVNKLSNLLDSSLSLSAESESQ